MQGIVDPQNIRLFQSHLCTTKNGRPLVQISHYFITQRSPISTAKPPGVMPGSSYCSPRARSSGAQSRPCIGVDKHTALDARKDLEMARQSRNGVNGHKRGKRGAPQTFAWKLYSILDSESPIVGWSPAGMHTHGRCPLREFEMRLHEPYGFNVGSFSAFLVGSY